ncbi:hypothetical protein [Cesiribacter andamanensis]|uniref:CHRD domain-containing protein n=1 Tax=Cesiribacter andamanensis AMV16 TaxID=1279009 RepID=M7NWP6_9BACT|nr:hypothetical protein [Cesiribacter andamanensis]EMR02869.1 hypothetical protein ADICEAN_02016 [Cesiribacter andamanensis AMV16]
MKKSIFTLAFAFIAFLAMHTAQAQNPHFTDVRVSNNGLTVSGKIAGLGQSSGLVTVTYTADVTATRTCSTRGNGKPVRPHTETKSLSASGEYERDRNGQVTFSLTLDPSSIGQDVDFSNCPNGLTQLVNIIIANKVLSFSTQSGESGSMQIP